jgi:hypothetical protein
MVREALARRVDTTIEQIDLRISKRSEALGIELRAKTLDGWMHPLFFEKVRRALGLIGEYEPRRLLRIQRDIRTIAGSRGGNSYYHYPLRLIVLSWPAVFPVTVADVALTIIHEATHARIAQAGIEYGDALRARIEAACVRQEAAFALRLPGGEGLAERQLGKLARPWWTPERLHESAVESARAHGVPEWLLRIMQKRHERRIRR